MYCCTKAQWLHFVVIFYMKKLLFFRLVCIADDLPGYTDGEVSNSSVDTAPYFVDEVVSYVCISGYKSTPPNITLTCTCSESVIGNLLWVCDPPDTTESCDYRKFFDHTPIVYFGSLYDAYYFLL